VQTSVRFEGVECHELFPRIGELDFGGEGRANLSRYASSLEFLQDLRARGANAIPFVPRGAFQTRNPEGNAKSK